MGSAWSEATLGRRQLAEMRRDVDDLGAREAIDSRAVALVKVKDDGAFPTAGPAVVSAEPVDLDCGDNEGDVPAFSGLGGTLRFCALTAAIPAVGTVLLVECKQGVWVQAS